MGRPKISSHVLISGDLPRSSQLAWLSLPQFRAEDSRPAAQPPFSRLRGAVCAASRNELPAAHAVGCDD